MSLLLSLYLACSVTYSLVTYVDIFLNACILFVILLCCSSFPFLNALLLFIYLFLEVSPSDRVTFESLYCPVSQELLYRFNNAVRLPKANGV